MPTSIAIERSRKRTFDHPAVFIYLTVICLVCWVVGYNVSLGYPVEEDQIGTPLWNWLCSLFPGKLFTYLTGFILMIGGAYLLQRANYALVLIREKTYFPLWLFILLLSTNPSFFPLKATSVGVFCMILAIYQLFTAYHDPFSTMKAFKTAFIIGLGSLLWVHILWFLPLFWIGMYNFRSLTPRTFVASLFGILTVFWFVFGWAVWKADFSVLTLPFASLMKLSFAHFELNGWADWTSLIYTAFLVIIASVNILVHEHGDSLRSRQFLSFLMLFTLWSFFLFFIYEHSSEEFIHIAVVSVSTLIAHFFTTRRNKYTFWLFLFTVGVYPILLFIQLWNFL